MEIGRELCHFTHFSKLKSRKAFKIGIGSRLRKSISKRIIAIVIVIRLACESVSERKREKRIDISVRRVRSAAV